MAFDNNKQRQSEILHLDLKGIKDALGGLNENLTVTTEGEEEGQEETAPVLPAIASALGSIAESLATIAERLNPLYMAEYVAPEPADDGEGGSDTPPADDNQGGE